MYLSNMSIEEARKYGTYEQLLESLEQEENELIKIKKESKLLERNYEVISEQLYFAREIIDQLEEALKQTTRLSEFKKEFTMILENSFLER